LNRSLSSSSPYRFVHHNTNTINNNSIPMSSTTSSSSSSNTGSNSNPIVSAFVEHQLVADVIPTAPPTLSACTVTYPSGAIVNAGNVLTPTQVKDEPNVKWPIESIDKQKNTLYTLILTDPDAPSRKDPKNREWCHWVVVNIPANSLSVSVSVSDGDTLVMFVPSAPPKHSGLHRYTYLVYKQPNRMDTSKEHIITNKSGGIIGRPNWSAKQFVNKHFGGQAELISGNFYQAEYDDNVPNVYKQLQ
jgi:phosphatidylethanolamine-binding protein (PEBP) family uncharacterized protein